MSLGGGHVGELKLVFFTLGPTKSLDFILFFIVGKSRSNCTGEGGERNQRRRMFKLTEKTMSSRKNENQRGKEKVRHFSRFTTFRLWG